MLREMLYPATTIVLLLSIGTLAYPQLEGWSYIDSLYFSTVTLATVGYGDITPHTDAGRLFTVGYIIFGVSTFFVILVRLGEYMILRHINETYDSFYTKLPIKTIKFKD